MTALSNQCYGLRVRLPAPSCPRNRQPRWSEAEPLWIVDRGFGAGHGVPRHAAGDPWL